MTDSYDSMTAINRVLPKQYTTHAFTLYAITLPSFLLAGLCFGWYGASGQLALLFIGLVTVGMAFDFLGHILGLYLSKRTSFLRWYARLNFCALCFGIPFTALAGSFVLAEVKPGSISAQIVDYSIQTLVASLAFGSLFLFARYRQVNIGGALEFVLDKSQTYTRRIFIARRMLLAFALLVCITVMIDGWNTEWRAWSLLFGGALISTVPLHILHKQIPSMAAELITQVIAVYGSWRVFVA